MTTPVLVNLTPTDLSKPISSRAFETPSYDWETQTRYEKLSAGVYTHNSTQTFDNFGKANDARGDNDD